MVHAEREWVGNGLRFATALEAEQQVRDLCSRWTLPDGWRVDPSDDAPNYRYVDGRLEPITYGACLAWSK